MSPDVYVARSLESALDALASADEHTRVLAGGTDLMVEMRTGRNVPRRIVDVWKVNELRGVREEPGGLRIGALTTCAELVRSPALEHSLDVLIAACSQVGAEQIQNRATIGGNLGTASPAADIVPVLVGLAARVRLMSLEARRELDLDEFLTGYRSTARRPNELIESIVVPSRASGERSAFRKVGTRRAQSISKVVLAVCVRLEGRRIVDVRAAAGSIAPKTIRLTALERELVGHERSDELCRRAALAAAREDAAPIDDVRSTADYRRQVLARILHTTLCELTGVDACRS